MRTAAAVKREPEKVIQWKREPGFDVTANQKTIRAARAMLLYATDEAMERGLFTEFCENCPFVKNPKRWFRLREVTLWLQREMVCYCLYINDVNNKRDQKLVDKVRDKMLADVSLFSCVSNKPTKQERIDEVTKRINEITSYSYLKKFIIDIANLFDRFYFYNINPRTGTYANITFNDNLLKEQAKIYKKLKVPYIYLDEHIQDEMDEITTNTSPPTKRN